MRKRDLIGQVPEVPPEAVDAVNQGGALSAGLADMVGVTAGGASPLSPLREGFDALRSAASSLGEQQATEVAANVEALVGALADWMLSGGSSQGGGAGAGAGAAPAASAAGPGGKGEMAKQQRLPPAPPPETPTA